jgi:hypothetical protein
MCTRRCPRTTRCISGRQPGTGGVIFTYNRDDFLAATRDAFAPSAPQAGLLILARKLPRDATRVAHALARWAEARRTDGRWPMQAYEVEFLSQ